VNEVDVIGSGPTWLFSICVTFHFVLVIPPFTVSLFVGLAVPIPTFPLLEIRIRSLSPAESVGDVKKIMSVGKTPADTAPFTTERIRLVTCVVEVVSYPTDSQYPNQSPDCTAVGALKDPLALII
jgi:hypothetical protein